MARPPIWIKDMRVEGPFFDEHGTPYARCTVIFRWWFYPLLWLNRLRSVRLGG